MSIFDGIAGSYDKWFDLKMGEFADKVESRLAFELLKAEKGMKVLDAGCGTGNFSIKLAKKGCRVIGIDVSEKMLQIGREKSEKEGLDIEFYNMDLYNLKFPDKSFDAVFSMAVFEFIKKRKKAFNEMMRVLKSGGKMLIGTIHKDSSWGNLYTSLEYKKNSIFKHADFMAVNALKNLAPESPAYSKECLFIPPGLNPEEYTMDNEKKYSKNEKGGFICAVWSKE